MILNPNHQKIAEHGGGTAARSKTYPEKVHETFPSLASKTTTPPETNIAPENRPS